MSTYQRIYDVNLLDDLHNYFPALLYQHTSFRTVQDVLGYIRERTIQRFNLFDYGRQQYDRSQPSTLFPQTQSFPQAQSTTLDPLLVLFESLRNGPGPSLGPSLGPLMTPAQTPSIYEDIIIHASTTMVNEASTEQTLDQDLETICTVCQDRMRQGEIVRKLNVCQHTFHKSCIDTWLLRRSVRCPTCRHDIREPTLATPTRRDTTASTSDLINIIFGRLA